MLLLIAGTALFTKRPESTDVPDTADGSGSGFVREKYEDMPFTKKQVKELENIYETAYSDEKKALDPYILAYAESYDEYGEMKEEFQSLVGVTEDFYQAVNDYDPNLKNVIAEDAGYRYGNGVLGNYLVEQGVGTVLGMMNLDRSFGQR